MPDYRTQDPHGWGGSHSRGAALGRPSLHGEPQGRLTLQRVHVNGGGYDRLGTYWGHGAPLFWCADDSGEVDFMVRASDREDAKAQVRQEHPGARFLRCPGR